MGQIALLVTDAGIWSQGSGGFRRERRVNAEANQKGYFPRRAKQAKALSLQNLKTSLWKSLGHAAGSKGLKGLAARWLRVLGLALASFTVNEVPVRAAALTFTTLLAFIPFVVILSIAAGMLGYLHLLSRLIPYLADSLNIHLSLEPILKSIDRAQRIGFHKLGIWGTLGLLLTFFLSMSNVEFAVNRVWNLRRQRGWLGRLRVYTPFLFLLLALVVAATLALLRARHGLESWSFGGKFPALHFKGEPLLFGALGILVFIWLALVLMIRILPNTRVRNGSALLGATAATVIIYFFSRLLFLFPSALMAENRFLYGSLAVFPVLLLLGYVFWAAALFGSAVAFVHQRLYSGGVRERRPESRQSLPENPNPWQEAVHEVRGIYSREET